MAPGPITLDGKVVPCCLRVKPWELSVLRLSDGQKAEDRNAILEAFATVACDGSTPLAAAVRHGGQQCLVVPSAAARRLRDFHGINSVDSDAAWIAMHPASADCLGDISGVLSKASIEAMMLSLPEQPPHMLVRAVDVSRAMTALVAAGYTVASAGSALCQPDGSHESAVSSAVAATKDWTGGLFGRGDRSSGSQLPESVSFRAGPCFVELHMPSTSKPDGSLWQKSCCGCQLAGQRRRLHVSLGPRCLQPGQPEDAIADWQCLSQGPPTAVFELASGPASGQHGYWIFAGGFFAQVVGLRAGEGLLGGVCCQSLDHLRRMHAANAVSAELRSHYSAVLGVAERPGVLRILRRSSCSDLQDGNEVMYTAGSSSGGCFDVDSAAGLVVHRLPGGGEQRWRILFMTEDPFTPTDGSLRIPMAVEQADLSEEERADDDGKKESKQKKARSRSRGKHKRSSKSPSIAVFEDSKKRSRSRGGKKTKSASASRDRDRRKDKKEEKKHRQRSSSSSSGRKSRRSKDSSRGKDKKRKDRSDSHAKKKDKEKDRDRGRSRSKEKTKDKDKGKDKDKDKKRKDDRSNSGRKDKDKKRKDEKSRSARRDDKKKKERSRSRSRSRRKEDKEKEKDRDRERERNRERDRDRDRERPRDPPPPSKRSGGGFDSRATLSDSAAPMYAFRTGNHPPPASGAVMTQLAALGAPGGALAISTEPDPEIEAFLTMNNVDMNAGQRLRNLPRHIQRAVLERGSLNGARDPSAVLGSRIRDATQGQSGTVGVTMPSIGSLGLISTGHSGIDQMIARYGIDAQCAQMLRQLPAHLQAMAAELPVHEARNPSAFVMSQLQSPRFRNAPAMPMGSPLGGMMLPGMYSTL
eukprot:TRINITY_DN74566_c0_g1_i1.p1 TRINITY_DN74566_c0_g1~~TRINITY_DN74566_c0_g1_i1.p1  ORF type:complete len:865 (-),score=176.11 TRINITY_DN74566_c0_g1_i1:35-2629(-)